MHVNYNAMPGKGDESIFPHNDKENFMLAEQLLRPVCTYLNIEPNIELECFVLKVLNFTLDKNKTFLFNIEGLKACPNEPLM